jgi:hypothetical protein
MYYFIAGGQYSNLKIVLEYEDLNVFVCPQLKKIKITVI